jgi:hypothetical protein
LNQCTLLDDFAVINFSEPTREEVLKMLFDKAELIDSKDGVMLTLQINSLCLQLCREVCKRKGFARERGYSFGRYGQRCKDFQ